MLEQLLGGKEVRGVLLSEGNKDALEKADSLLHDLAQTTNVISYNQGYIYKIQKTLDSKDIDYLEKVWDELDADASRNSTDVLEKYFKVDKDFDIVGIKDTKLKKIIKKIEKTQ